MPRRPILSLLLLTFTSVAPAVGQEAHRQEHITERVPLSDADKAAAKATTDSLEQITGLTVQGSILIPGKVYRIRFTPARILNGATDSTSPFPTQSPANDTSGGPPGSDIARAAATLAYRALRRAEHVGAVEVIVLPEKEPRGRVYRFRRQLLEQPR